MTCCDVSRGVSVLFSLTLSWVNAAPSRRTISNFKVWSWHSGPDLDVMDNPSSVITQVSRDEEGNKAVGERGKLLIYYIYIYKYINFFLNTPVQSCGGKKEKKSFATPELRAYAVSCLWAAAQIKPVLGKWTENKSEQEDRAVVCTLWLRPFGLWWKVKEMTYSWLRHL